MTFEIREDDLSGDATQALVAFHLREMHSHSPATSVFALDLAGLRAKEVTVWTAWLGSNLAAVGALKQLSDASGEIKSMRTHPDYVRQGAASCILEHIIGEAKRRGLYRLSLETGRGSHFEAALSMYRRRGFASGEAFSGYLASEFNQFFHLAL